MNEPEKAPKLWVFSCKDSVKVPKVACENLSCHVFLVFVNGPIKNAYWLRIKILYQNCMIPFWGWADAVSGLAKEQVCESSFDDILRPNSIVWLEFPIQPLVQCNPQQSIDLITLV